MTLEYAIDSQTSRLLLDDLPKRFPTSGFIGLIEELTICAESVLASFPWIPHIRLLIDKDSREAFMLRNRISSYTEQLIIYRRDVAGIITATRILDGSRFRILAGLPTYHGGFGSVWKAVATGRILMPKRRTNAYILPVGATVAIKLLHQRFGVNGSETWKVSTWTAYITVKIYDHLS